MIEIKNLRVSYPGEFGFVPALAGVSLSLQPGERLAVVGESGCGKSTLALSVPALLPRGCRLEGQVLVDGIDMLKCDEKTRRNIRSEKLGWIPQNPMTSLTPHLSVCDQMSEALRLRGGMSRGEAVAACRELLLEAGLENAGEILTRRPHELSGGQRQRVLIAAAVSSSPGYLLADEPTTALDVTVQAKVLNLLRRMQEKVGAGLLLITHNLGVVSECADRVVVLYAGETVESGPVRELLNRPRHPYTLALRSAVPGFHLKPKQRLPSLKGSPPVPGTLMGCPLAPRCPHATGECESGDIPWKDAGENHRVKCVLDEAPEASVEKK